MSRRRNRKHSIIDSLNPELKTTIEQMLLEGSMTYSEIVDYLKGKGVSISPASVCRYARAYHANVQLLNIAQENFSRMMSELEKYPDLDTTEALSRVASQHVLNAMTNVTEEDFKKVPVDDLLRQATALMRAVAYKKKVDLQNKSDVDVALDAAKAMVFDTLAKEKPDLYKELSDYIAKKKEQLNNE